MAFLRALVSGAENALSPWNVTDVHSSDEPMPNTNEKRVNKLCLLDTYAQLRRIILYSTSALETRYLKSDQVCNYEHCQKKKTFSF